MTEMLEKIGAIGIVPVVKLDNPKDSIPLAEALCQGGLPCAEITFRTSAAEEAIRQITKAFPNMLVGAGTVLTTDQVERAVNAGAAFIVSPGFNPEVVKYCVDKGVPIIPGCSSPSDIEQAIAMGLEVVKFFPAEAAGGLNMIKAISAPYVNMKFMPTGGIDTKNLNDYLGYSKVLACGGSWMVKSDLINAGDFDRIKVLAREAVQLVLGFDLAHVGINARDEKSAGDIAGVFDCLFGFAQKGGHSSIFAGTAVEVMKIPSLGANGHIAIRTNHIGRAISYLANQGVEFDQNSKKYDEKCKIIAIYLVREIGGFAIHLVQKK